MAVIKTETISFLGRKFAKKISCNASGKFSVNLPAEVAESLGVHIKVVGSTLDEVEREFYKHINSYKESVTTERKVIACKFAAMNISIQRNSEFVFLGKNHYSYDSASLQLSACVYIEKTTKHANGRETKTYIVEKSTIPRSFHGDSPDYVGNKLIIIDWTEEREKTIAKLCENFEELILRLTEVFKDEDNLISSLLNGTNLLPESIEVKEC